jgi:MFS family permease
MTIGPAIHAPEPTLRPAQRWWILTAVECGNFAVYMDGFIVTLALPTMTRHFGVDIHDIKWVMISYLATLTVGLLFAGRLADIWTRRLVTIIGMALLTAGALLCALAPTLPVLIGFRVMQGLGAPWCWRTSWLRSPPSSPQRSDGGRWASTPQSWRWARSPAWSWGAS